MRRLIYICCILLVITLNSNAAIFTVTSNADSGPGTFREALTLAAGNGSALKDYIHFNLTGTTRGSRTITISTALPKLSSNLVIDGSTQPGTPFGVSDARVILLARIQGEYIGVLECYKESDIELYGLMFEKSPDFTTGYYAFEFTAVKGLILGAPGKGNLFKIGISVMDISFPKTEATNFSENVKISANIFGLDEDGETLAKLFTPTSMFLRTIKNLTIGGETPAEGNCISYASGYIDYVATDLPTGYYKFINNRVGVNFTGTKTIPNGVSGSNINFWGTHTESVEVRANLFSGSSYLHLAETNSFIKVTGNKFGLDITGTKVLGTDYCAIIIGYCRGGGIIGGTALADKNIFAGGWATRALNGEIGEVINIGSPKFELINNSFYCNKTPVPYSINTQNKFVAPVAAISSRSANQINGTASPGSRVDLYYSLNCNFCEPEKYFASVTADNSGNWEYKGSLQPDNIIVAGTLDGQSSLFTLVRFDNQPADVKLRMVCNGEKGSITGIAYKNASSATWYNEAGSVVGTGADLKDVPTGKYKLVITDGFCSQTTPFYEIKDNTIAADITAIKINDAGCGQSNGSITGIQPNGLTYEWRDQTGLIHGSSLNLTNVQSGVYTLTVLNGTACSAVIGPFAIKISNGKSVDDGQVKLVNPSCGRPNGSIKGLLIRGTNGTVTYTWRNSSSTIVGNTQDLTDVPQGNYTLQITDGASCPAVSRVFELKATNPISLNDNTVNVSPSACGSSTGSIKGITVSGASRYEWLNQDGTLYETTTGPDLLNVPGGNYRLRVINNGPCVLESKLITVLQPAMLPFPDYPASITRPCDMQNGSIVVSFNSTVLPKAIEWRDASGKVVGTTGSITSTPAGTYRLFLTDANDCKSLYRTYELTKTPALTLNTSAASMTNAYCGKKTGSIKFLTGSGGIGTYNYRWFDDTGNIVATTADLINISAGNYVLELSDQSTCKFISEAFVIKNDEVILKAPQSDNVWICAPGDAVIKVNNNQRGIYRLYETLTSNAILASSQEGIFKVDVDSEKTFYLSFADGDCESPRTEITVYIGTDELNISNVFTPNNDGVNDHWKLDNMFHYPEARIKIFNRNGTVIFESIGYKTPFDGKRNGSDLPLGSYFYLIELRRGCIPLKGSITILR